MAEPIEASTPSERVATLMAQPHGDLSDAAEQLAALVAAATAELLEVISAIDRKESWRDDGATSTTAWVVAMLRVSHLTAQEWVRVGRSLDQLPHVREAYSEGMLSWDQLRHATVFLTPRRTKRRPRSCPASPPPSSRNGPSSTAAAPPPTRRARSSTDRSPGAGTATPTASATRASSPPRRAASSTPPSSNGLSGSGKDPVTGVWGSENARCADALVDLARDDVLAHPGPDPTVVVVHVDADVVDGTAEGNGSIDGIPVPVDTVRRLLCDCDVEFSVDGPDGTCIGIGRAGRTPPRWLRRRPTHRDGTCRFPGCDRRIRHLHHIQHWTAGGPTDSYNLSGLCWEHHHLVHEGGWTLEGNADAELTFTSPFGRRLRSRPRPLDPNVRRRAQDASDTNLGAAATTSHPPAPTHPDDPAPRQPARPRRAATALSCWQAHPLLAAMPGIPTIWPNRLRSVVCLTGRPSPTSIRMHRVLSPESPRTGRSRRSTPRASTPRVASRSSPTRSSTSLP